MNGLVKAPIRINKFVPHSNRTVTEQKAVNRAANPIPVLKPERFDQLAHDARNVLSALRLYCDLLDEPGVLTSSHLHYAEELRAVTDTATRLVEKLAAPQRAGARRRASKRRQSLTVETPALAKSDADGTLAVGLAHDSWSDIWSGPNSEDNLDDLAAELVAMRPLLSAIAGPRVVLEVETLPCGGRTRLAKEDLIRVLLNLVRNASEAMPEGGKLRITAQYADGMSFLEDGLIPAAGPRSVIIAVEDNGPGIPESLREKIFTAGFTTSRTGVSWPAVQHRGLGLSIVRSLIGAAGGTVSAGSSPGGGARFEIDLPITSGMYEIADPRRLVADSATKGCIECP
jgi:signal transduction histidine kinase